MNRYIDVDALYDFMNRADIPYNALIQEAIDFQPSISIVRCKDCRHRIHDEERCLYYCEMYYGQGDVSDDNFCQWGAKMDGDMSDGERSEE